jgi:hypothetical protein
MTDENRSLAEWAASEANDGHPVVEAPAPEIPEHIPEPAVEEVPIVEEAPVDGSVEAQPESVVEETPAEPVPQKKPQPLPKWMKDRLAEITAKQHEADRRAAEEKARADASEAALEALRRKAAAGEPLSPDPVVEPAPKAPDGFVPATEVDSRARQIAAEQAFNARADASYHEGKKVYPDFDDAVGTLAAMSAIQRRDFQEAALATGAAHDVIYHLGSNPEEAQAVLSDLASGSIAKATAEMTKIATKIAASKSARPTPKNEISAAPAPIRPVGGSAVPHVDLDKASDDDFTTELDKRARAHGWW